MWFIHTFPLDRVPLRSRVGNIKTPASVELSAGDPLSPNHDRHQLYTTWHYWFIRIDNLWEAVDTLIQVSEFGRIIGYEKKIAVILHPHCLVLWKGGGKVIPTWILQAYQFFPTSNVDVASRLAWG